jgi:hypothetical protein
MATLTFNKQKLIELLKEKKAKVIADSKKETDHYKSEAVKSLEKSIKEYEAELKGAKEDLELVKAGKAPKNRYFRSYDENNLTYKFDAQIKRLELSDNVTVTMTDRGTDDLFRLIS